MNESNICVNVAEYIALHRETHFLKIYLFIIYLFIFWKPIFECALRHQVEGCVPQYCADCGRVLAPREKRLGVLESTLSAQGIPMTKGPRPKVKIASFW